MDAYRDTDPLVVRGLNKSYGRARVLSELNLTLAPGSVHGLVGLNGSGKTTTLECILGMLAYDSGSIRVLGLSPEQLWRAQGAVVGVFDTPGLHPGLTVRQALEHARLLCPRPVRSAAELETLLGIDRFRDYRIRQLSLGNRRRASIAQALVGEPALVILDEPFNGLDAGGVDDVLALVGTLNRECGTTFLLSSHQLPYLERICSHLTILHEGRIGVSDHVDTLIAGRRPRLYLRCDDLERATRLVATAAGVTLVAREAERLCLQLEGMTASEVNRLLVGEGLAVSELLPEKPSLDAIFRNLTESARTEPESREAARA